MNSATDGPPLFTTFCLQNKWTLLISLVVTTCVFTRIKTGRQFKRSLAHKDASQPRPVPMLPYWLPWIGHSLHYISGMQEYFIKVCKTYPGGVFALRIAGGTHNVIISPSLAREIQTKRNLPIGFENFVYYACKMFFGDGGEIGRVCETPEGYETIWDGAHRAVGQLMRDPFLSTGISRTTKAVGEQIWNLTSGNANPTDQSPWERAACVQILPGDNEKGEFVAEADAHKLLRNWISSIASPLIVGSLFMENNPSFVEDLWVFDGNLELFMTGLPRGIVPSLTAAYAARDRLQIAMREWHQAMFDVLDGKQPEAKYHDLSDVPQLMWDRARITRKAGASLACNATNNLSIVWAMNVNANHIIWWMVFYIYSNKALLAQIREEIRPFVGKQESETADSPIDKAPKLDINVQALWNECPLLKGAFYETLRLEAASASFKQAKEDFTITESLEDALIAGKTEPDTYILKKGDFICTNNYVHQSSGVYFNDPEVFNVKRFWVQNRHERTEVNVPHTKTQSTNSDISVEYGKMNSWGGGKTVCKGRNFAEREIMIFASAIITCWEIQPADNKMINVDGSWKHPGRKMGAGSTSPLKDLRIKIWRRKLT